MIFEEIVVSSEKVRSVGFFLHQLYPGELKYSEEDIFLDLGNMLMKAADEIKGYAEQLEPAEWASIKKEPIVEEEAEDREQGSRVEFLARLKGLQEGIEKLVQDETKAPTDSESQ